MRLRNQTGAAVNIDYYEVTSAGNALNSTAWNSFQEQNLAGFPAGNGSGNGWEQAGGSSSGVLSESYLTGNSAVANNANDRPGRRVQRRRRTILSSNTALLTDAPPTRTATTTTTAPSMRPTTSCGATTLDQSVTLPNDSTPGTVTPADYTVWKANFGNTGGPTGTSTLITGFVRYVTSAVGAVVRRNRRA